MNSGIYFGTNADDPLLTNRLANPVPRLVVTRDFLLVTRNHHTEAAKQRVQNSINTTDGRTSKVIDSK
jgi:hypothetical protein